MLAVVLSTASFAQPKEPQGPRHGRHQERPKVEEMVSNLSKRQQSRLEAISADSRAQVEKKRAELNAVRQTIRQLMEKEGDQSAKIFPLLDREAALEADISKIMYRTRLQIDEVLTKEQVAELRAKIEADQKDRDAKCKRAPGNQPPPPSGPKTVHRKVSKLPPAKK